MFFCSGMRLTRRCARKGPVEDETETGYDLEDWVLDQDDDIFNSPSARLSVEEVDAVLDWDRSKRIEPGRHTVN
jgi:hypothetical protein